MRRAWPGILAATALVACSGGQPSVDPARELRDAGNAMAQLKSVSATLKFTKGTITFQGFTLVSARTSVRLPADSDTVLTLKEQDISISLEVVISGGHVYLHLPFSPFRELSGPEAQAMPDLAKLFNPSTGLPAVIPAGAKPSLVSTDLIDGVSTYQVATSYTADQVHSLLAQLNSSGSVGAHLWVDVSDHLIHKAVLDGGFGDGGKEASIEVDLNGFNAPVSISSPSP